MSAMVTPRALARSSSTVSWYCGSSFRPFGRTAERILLCAAMPRNWLRASISLSWPTPARSCRNTSKPVALPSSSTAGGAKANTIASRKLKKCCWARCARLNTLFSAERSPHGLSMMNAMPELWPRPAKLKPLTVNTEATVSASLSSR
ncbi:hypothetical protein D3C85_1296970 [compost metagenome]